MPSRTQRHARHSAAASFPANQFAPHGSACCHEHSTGRELIQHGRRPNVGRAHFSTAADSLVHTGIGRASSSLRNSPKTGGLRAALGIGQVGKRSHHSRTSATPKTLATIPACYIRRPNTAGSAQCGPWPDVAIDGQKTSPECPTTTGVRCLLTEAETRRFGRTACVTTTLAAHPVGLSSPDFPATTGVDRLRRVASVGSHSLGSPSTNAARYLSVHSWQRTARTQWVACRVGFIFGDGSGMAPSSIVPAGERTRRGVFYIGGGLRESRVIGPQQRPLRGACTTLLFPKILVEAAATSHNEVSR